VVGEGNGRNGFGSSHKLPKVLTKTQVRRLMDVVDVSSPTGLRNRVAMELMHRAGLRVGEVVALQPKDINLEDGLVFVREGKGAKDRVVPLDAGTMQWCRMWQKTRRPRATWWLHVIKHHPGQQMSVRSLQQAVSRYAAKADLEDVGITPHVLRHTYATELMQDPEFSARDVQELLGHSSLTTTQIYTHVSQTELAEKIRRRSDQGSLDTAPSSRAVAMGQALEAAGITPEQLKTFLGALEQA